MRLARPAQPAQPVRRDQPDQPERLGQLAQPDRLEPMEPMERQVQPGPLELLDRREPTEQMGQPALLDQPVQRVEDWQWAISSFGYPHHQPRLDSPRSVLPNKILRLSLIRT